MGWHCKIIKNKMVGRHLLKWLIAVTVPIAAGALTYAAHLTVTDKFAETVELVNDFDSTKDE